MENKLQNITESSNLEDYMIQKKIDLMVEMAYKKVASELGKMNDVITRLSDEIIGIKKQLSEGIYAQKTRAVPVFENKKSQEDLKTAKQEEQPSKPRYGDYKPEDVGVDKFFYFGNKK